MAIIALPPKFSFTGVPKFGLQRRSSKLRSKYMGAGQYVVFPYAVWMLDGNLLEYDGQDAGNMRAFLVDLEGPKHQFRLPVPGFTKPIAGWAGNPTSRGDVGGNGAVRALSLAIQGMTGIINKGDFFTVNDELKLITETTAPVAGLGTISFKPGLRKAVVGGTVLNFQNPTVLMRAADDDVATISLTPPVRQGVPNFNAIEAVDI
jgi:hypothetical protein